jgi:hypothetical protein
MSEKEVTNEELERMFEQTDKLLAPYYNGIAEGEKRERERIVKLLRDSLFFVDCEGLALGKNILRVEPLISFIKGELDLDNYKRKCENCEVAFLPTDETSTYCNSCWGDFPLL